MFVLRTERQYRASRTNACDIKESVHIPQRVADEDADIERIILKVMNTDKSSELPENFAAKAPGRSDSACLSNNGQGQDEWNVMFDKLKTIKDHIVGEFSLNKRTDLYRWLLEQEFLFKLRETGDPNALSDTRLQLFMTIGFFQEKSSDTSNNGCKILSLSNEAGNEWEDGAKTRSNPCQADVLRDELDRRRATTISSPATAERFDNAPAQDRLENTQQSNTRYSVDHADTHGEMDADTPSLFRTDHREETTDSQAATNVENISMHDRSTISTTENRQLQSFSNSTDDWDLLLGREVEEVSAVGEEQQHVDGLGKPGSTPHSQPISPSLRSFPIAQVGLETTTDCFRSNTVTASKLNHQFFFSRVFRPE